MDHIPPSHYEQKLPEPLSRCDESIKSAIIQQMEPLYGWCSTGKALVLADIILKSKAEVVVEIGVWGGKSLVPMAYALKENGKGAIYGIDPWESRESVQGAIDEAHKNFWGSANHHWVLGHLIQKIEEFHLQNQIRLIKTSSEHAPLIPDIDVLHIDGNHSEQASYLDVLKWVPLVKSGGWIIFDDMKWNEGGLFTTKKATDWLDEHCQKFLEITDTCTWGVWIKP